MKKTDLDKAVIAALGGPAVLARRLGFTAPGSVQRVYNWLERGIPAAVRLQHMSLFASAERKLSANRGSKREAA